ncbi:MAG: hypothetical protein Rubg2KO_36750 [Rubricoccaceae bacterium]
MTVSAIAAQALQSAPSGPIRVRTQPDEGGSIRPSRIGSGPAFGETMTNAIERVDLAQKTSDAQVEAFIAGETENTHEVMIAMNQAELHFQLLAEVRNKLLEGYQEIMRMQV